MPFKSSRRSFNHSVFIKEPSIILTLFSNLKVRQTVVLTATRFAGVGLGFAVSIINTRFLDTDDYGRLKFIQQIFIILPTLLGFGFSYSVGRLVACREHADRNAELARASFLLFALLSLLGTVLLLGFSFFVDKLFDSDVRWLLFCLSPFAFIYFFRVSVSNLLQGQNRIYSFSGWELLPQLLYVLISYIFIRQYNFSLSASLTITASAGTVITFMYLYNMSQKDWRFERSDLQLIFQENKTNGFHIYSGILSNVLLAQLIPIFVGYYADMKSVGYYGLALTMSGPLMFIPSAVGTVMFKSFANHGRIKSNVLAAAMISSSLAYLAFFFLIEYVVKIVYPPEYIVTVPMARLLGIGMVFHGMGDMFNRFLGAHGQGKKLRNAAFVVGGVIIICMAILMPFYDIWGGIITKAGSSCIYLLSMFWYYKQSVKDGAGSH